MLGGGTSQFMSFPQNWEKASIFAVPGYHKLYKQKGIFHKFIKDIYYLPQKDCIFTGVGKNGVFADNPLKFRMVALRIYER
jgi:hypothetical protein